MSRELKTFLPQRKVEDLRFFGNQYFWSGVFLCSAPKIGEGLFFEIYFSKVSVLPSFKISITGLKTIWRLQPPVSVLLPLCRQLCSSFELVGNLYLTVQLLLRECFNAIAQQKILNCKNNFNDETI